MKNSILIIIILILSSCEKEYEFKATIIVNEYYSGNPISNLKVFQSDCTTGYIWGTSCDINDILFTDKNGIINYSASKENKYGKFYEFQTSITDTFMTSGSKRVKNGESTTLRIKPFIKSILRINHNINHFDSIKVYVGNNNGTADIILLNDKNPKEFSANTIPDERNYLLVYVYNTDSLLTSLSTEFTPILDSMNYFEFDLNK